jgi:methylglutaconyl-CoA hydratase
METVRIETDARGVARLTLARSEKRNAMSAVMIGELTEAAAMLGGEASVRVVVLAADGPVFSAGGDLAWMQAQMAADPATRIREARSLAMMLKALNEMPKPLIGRVQGNAFGGGVGLISVCDVAVAAEGARFGLTETRLGLIPATIGPYVVARLGGGMTRRVFMSSRLFGADEAVALGLIGRAVPGAELDAAVEAEVAPYLGCAPGAVAEAKALAWRLGGGPGEDAVEASIEALVRRWESDEARVGTEAFFAGRKAPWAGDT